MPPETRDVFSQATKQARAHGHDHVDTQHILLGLLLVGEPSLMNTLVSLGIKPDVLLQTLDQAIGNGTGSPVLDVPFTDGVRTVLEFSSRESLELGDGTIRPEHILLGLIREHDGVAANILDQLGADYEVTRAYVMTNGALVIAPEQKPESKTPPKVNRPIFPPDNPFKGFAAQARVQFQGIQKATRGAADIIICTMAGTIGDVCSQVIENRFTRHDIEDPVEGQPLSLLKQLRSHEVSIESIAMALEKSILSLAGAPDKNSAHAWLQSLVGEVRDLVPIVVQGRPVPAPYEREIGGG